MLTRVTFAPQHEFPGPSSALQGAEPLEFEYLGLADEPPTLVEYHRGWDIQKERHASVAAREIPGRVLFVEHVSVYTAGRQTRPDERPFDGTPVVDVDRGGNITWHGPGQLVGYPIVRLPDRVGVVDHVRRVEQAVIELLADYGIEAGRVPGRTGVWLPADDPASVPVVVPPTHHHAASTERTGNYVPGLAGAPGAPGLRIAGVEGHTPDVLVPQHVGVVGARPLRPERKICAIGIRVTQRTTLHGFALNVTNSSSGFENIVPCGIADAGVTSMEQELDGPAPTLLEVARRLQPLLAQHLTRQGHLTSEGPLS